MTRPEECLAVVDGIGAKAALVALESGDILIALPGGRFTRSADRGLTWSQPWQGVDAGGRKLASGSAQLVRLAGSAIGYVGRTTDPAAPGDSVGSPQYLNFWRSDDGGKTWGRPVRVGPPQSFGVEAMHDTIVRTASGRLVLPVYGYMTAPRDPTYHEPVLMSRLRNQWIATGTHQTDPRFMWCYAYLSDDDGRSWRVSRTPQVYVWDAATIMWHRTSEPTVVEVEPGRLLMFMRVKLGRLFKSWSLDNGETWTAPTPTPLASSNAPAQLRKIPSTGDLLVVWSQHSEEEVRKGMARTRLSSAISRTHGATWEFFQNVESVREGTFVEPGPIRSARPEGAVYGALDPAPERRPEEMTDLPDAYVRCAYPGVLVAGDRVIVTHSNATYSEVGEYRMGGRLKVLPVSWFYGGAKFMKPVKDVEETLRYLRGLSPLPAEPRSYEPIR